MTDDGEKVGIYMYSKKKYVLKKKSFLQILFA
jgi:hypothetical protein